MNITAHFEQRSFQLTMIAPPDNVASPHAHGANSVAWGPRPWLHSALSDKVAADPITDAVR
ncbi:hypothetical protein IP70_09325 [alpha proteobacterium AAP38]|nr:hypothetical protein IP70_09325 [alpha proteobacterium AAP38]